MRDGADQPAAPEPDRRRVQTLDRVALVQTVLLIGAVVLALPFALNSMVTQLTGQQETVLYDLPTAQPLPADTDSPSTPGTGLVRIAVIDLDEVNSSITLAVSGIRTCDPVCPRLDLAVFALDTDPTVRRALPPYARLAVQPEDVMFSQTVELPMSGEPIRYPFDGYRLTLGVAATEVSDATQITLTPERSRDTMAFATQNQLTDFQMRPPVMVEPSRVVALPAPYQFLGVQALQFNRPVYLPILSVLLVLLITVSAMIAVAMWDLSTLVIGVGSLVLGIWGVRSILVPRPLPVITSIDLALALVILFVLLGLSVRAAWYFQRRSHLPAVHLRRRHRE